MILLPTPMICRPCLNFANYVLHLHESCYIVSHCSWFSTGFLTNISLIYTVRQASVPLEATGPYTAGLQPPTPPREANDSFLPETPQSSAIPTYTPITPPEEKSRSPSPPLLIPPKSITEMDRNAKILANFFLKQVSDNCDENQIKELGVILLGPTTYDRLQQKAMTAQNKLVELIFFEWITSRGKDANYTELSDAFKKMRHQNLYDRLCFYRREEGRLYCAEIFIPVS